MLFHTHKHSRQCIDNNHAGVTAVPFSTPFTPAISYYVYLNVEERVCLGPTPTAVCIWPMIAFVIPRKTCGKRGRGDRAGNRQHASGCRSHTQHWGVNSERHMVDVCTLHRGPPCRVHTERERGAHPGNRTRTALPAVRVRFLS